MFSTTEWGEENENFYLDLWGDQPKNWIFNNKT